MPAHSMGMYDAHKSACTWVPQGSQLRTEIALLAWKSIHVPLYDICPAHCECHYFSGSHLSQLRKYPVLCKSPRSTLTKGIVSQDFPVYA